MLLCKDCINIMSGSCNFFAFGGLQVTSLVCTKIKNDDPLQSCSEEGGLMFTEQMRNVVLYTLIPTQW